jgi:hypothetical protein
MSCKCHCRSGSVRAKLKILYLTELSATGGGGEVVLCDLASEIARKGHTVHMICHQSKDDTCRISDSLHSGKF